MQQMRETLDEADRFKVIAFPVPTIDVPVVATSWGQMVRFESFDRATALRITSATRNRAPEPHAP